jgi:hypothetical protein
MSTSCDGMTQSDSTADVGSRLQWLEHELRMGQTAVDKRMLEDI